MVIIMNNLECNYLIELIRNVLNNEKTEYREDVDYKKLFNIAKMHTLVIYLYYGLKDYDIPVLSDLLKKAYSENIYKTAVQEAEKENIINELEKNGIKVIIGHNPENVIGSDVVVYTAAVKDDNVELISARNLNIPTIERADFLGEITRCYNDTITISGTHGKSTTTSMVSLCFLEALKDPSIQVGAELPQINGNYRVGDSEYFIIEAC